MRLLLLACAWLWLAASPASAAIYYVATNGSDARSCATASTGLANAKATISNAVACAVAGDTVQVGPGTFTQRINTNATAGGSAGGGPVIIQGTLPLGTTKLSGTGLGNGWMIYGRHVTYTTIRYFEILGHTGGGIGLFGDTTHSAITDNYVHDNAFVCCQGSGIRVTSRFDPSTNTVQGSGVIGTAHHVTIARNTLRNLTTGFTAQLPTNGTESLTVAADISQFVIEDNLIDFGQFIGIDLIGKTAGWWGQIPGQRTTPATPWPRKGIVRRNTVKSLKLGMGGGDAGLYCDGCRDIVFEQNRVDGANGHCIAVSAEEGGFLTSHVITRFNIGINCTSDSFMQGPPNAAAGQGLSEHLRFIHNTGLRTKAGGPVMRWNHAPGGQSKNNILAAASATPPPYMWHGPAYAASAFPLLNYNLYHGGNNAWEYKGVLYLSFAAYKAGTGQDAQGIVADPKFTNVVTRDLSLQASSPALDAGTSLTLTVGGSTGTVVTVQDARYWIDGYGMTAGDPIQIGTQQAVVSAVNYATNQITLDRVLTWTNGMAVNYPYTGTAPNIGACEGVGTCVRVAPPPAGTTIAPAVALDLTHTCGTASNSLSARVMGSLVYLAPGTTYEAPMLARGQCASAVAITDSASVPARPLLPPWHWLGTAGPNTGNSCTNCLSVHGGTASINASGSGYTLSTFKEGASVSAATAGAGAYTALPGLCRQVVDGVVTSTPLWPWPMEARIAAARSLAVSTPVNVTQAVAAALGPIPGACTFTPPVLPPPQTTWVIARTMASPAGVDGAACTVEAPCATLAHVASRMGSASGQTIYLRGGTYSQRLTPGLFPPGTSWEAPTTLAAYGGETVTLQLDTGIVVALSDPAKDRYLLLDGLTLDGSASSSTTTQGLIVTNGAGPIRFRGGIIRNTALERVILENSQEVELLDSTIRTGDSGVAVLVQGATQGTRLHRLLIETSPTHGVQVVGQDHTQLWITQNRIRTNVGTGVVLGATQQALGATEVRIENNLITGNGAGMQIGFGAANNTLVHNTIADNTGVGLQIDDGASQTLVTNTLLWGNGTQLLDTSGGETVLTTNLEIDPGFVGGGDYHLALDTSPAADAGTCLPGVVDLALDEVTRPQPPDGACDIGAYERAGFDAPPLPTPGALSARPYGSRLFLLPH